MENIYKRYFKGDYIPEWISIAAAFSYLQELLRASNGGDSVPEGDIDLTIPKEQYDIPGAQILSVLRGRSPELCLPSENCVMQVDEALLIRLADGTIRCRGRNRKTVRTLEINDDRDFRKDLQFIDRYQTEQEDEPINQRFWKEIPCVNYGDSVVVVWEIKEEDLHSDINRQDGVFINMECTRDGKFIASGCSYMDQDVFWKEEWIDLQVCTSDLLRSTEALFGKYAQKQSVTEGMETAQMVLKATGRNRFFYSSVLARWVVEFREMVFSLDFTKNSPLPLTIKYLLENGSTNVSEAIEKCGWVYLDDIGSKTPLPDPVMIGNMDEEGMSTLGFFSIQEKLDGKSFSFLRDEQEGLKKCLEDELSLEKREEILEDIKKIDQFLANDYSKTGKTRTFIDTPLKRRKDVVVKRIIRFKEKIPKEGGDFLNHLNETMAPRPEGYIYKSNEQWATKDQ